MASGRRTGSSILGPVRSMEDDDEYRLGHNSSFPTPTAKSKQQNKKSFFNKPSSERRFEVTEGNGDFGCRISKTSKQSRQKSRPEEALARTFFHAAHQDDCRAEQRSTTNTEVPGERFDTGLTSSKSSGAIDLCGSDEDTDNENRPAGDAKTSGKKRKSGALSTFLDPQASANETPIKMPGEGHTVRNQSMTEHLAQNVEERNPPPPNYELLSTAIVDVVDNDEKNKSYSPTQNHLSSPIPRKKGWQKVMDRATCVKESLGQCLTEATSAPPNDLTPPKPRKKERQNVNNRTSGSTVLLAQRLTVPKLKKFGTTNREKRTVKKSHHHDYDTDVDTSIMRETSPANITQDGSARISSKVRDLRVAQPFPFRASCSDKVTTLLQTKQHTSVKSIDLDLSFKNVNHPNSSHLNRKNASSKKKKNPTPIEIGSAIAGSSSSTKNVLCSEGRIPSSPETVYKTQAAARLSTSNSQSSTPLRPTRSATKRSKNETIEILSSDDENNGNMEDEATVTKWHLVRVAINSDKVFKRGCELQVDAETTKIQFSYMPPRKVQKHIIVSEDVDECTFLSLSESVLDSNEAHEDQIQTLKEHEINFVLSMRVDAAAFRNEALRSRLNDVEKEITTVTMQFKIEQDLTDLRGIMDDLRLKVSRMDLDDNNELLHLLLEDERKSRIGIGSRKRKKNLFSSSKPFDEILIVYPFAEDRNKMEVAAHGLPMFAAKSVEHQPDETEPSDALRTREEFRQRSHYVTIRVEDYDRLEPDVWLNDSLVDFFMLWISRDIENIHASDVHFFTSHFYTTLAKNGPDAVTSWTAKKKIDIFQKKLIFIPINKSMHWSLCVVVNPGAIRDFDPEQVNMKEKLPCLLCFDSLKMHCPQTTKKKITSWLNSEWMRLRKTDSRPFTESTFRVCSPEVPRQDNGSDCGVFVCRYALALYGLRSCSFTAKDAFPDVLPSKISGWKKGFQSLFRGCSDFHFDSHDIDKTRQAFQTFIENLSEVYKRFQKGQKKSPIATMKATTAASSSKELGVENMQKIACSNSSQSATEDYTQDAVLETGTAHIEGGAETDDVDPNASGIESQPGGVNTREKEDLQAVQVLDQRLGGQTKEETTAVPPPAFAKASPSTASLSAVPDESLCRQLSVSSEIGNAISVDNAASNNPLVSDSSGC